MRHASTLTLLLAVLLPGTLLAQSPAVQESLDGIGRLDPVPAATLLLPYFEVDLAAPSGRNTLFWINNAIAEPTLAHITFWTNLSVPTLDFDVYLTGFDVTGVDLRQVFTTGVIPQTGPGTSPLGSYSFPDVNFPACDFPLGNLPGILVDHIRTMHTGQQSPLTGDCGGRQIVPDLATGYVTVDVVNACNFLFPSNSGYFEDDGSPTTGVATNDNVLWGDWMLLDPGAGTALSEPLVHLEARGSLANGYWTDTYTFYGRYSGGADNREPLPTRWAVPYVDSGASHTELVVWRDTGINQTEFPCGTLPIPYPLGSEDTVFFDEEENHGAHTFPANFFPPPMPWAANRSHIFELFSPFASGWLLLDLNVSTGGYRDPVKQSYVAVLQHRTAGFQSGYRALPLDSGIQPAEPPAQHIFSDGFESFSLFGLSWTLSVGGP